MRGSVDVEVARWISEHRADPVTTICRHLEDIGTSMTYLAIAGLIGLAVVAFLGLWAGLPRLALAGVFTLVVTSPLKELFDRPRPPADLAITHVSGPAMPSSHAIVTSTAVAAIVMAPWWTSRRLRVAAAVLGGVGCMLAAAAMIYLGGHWLSDVLVGWTLGAGLTVGAMLLLKRVGMT